MKSRGFTLLEMLVATLIMGIAVVTLLSDISTSLRNASRVTDNDRAALAAKRKMDELLLDTRFTPDTILEGRFDPAATGMNGGWKARLTVFEAPPDPTPGTPLLERVELEIWWESGVRRRTLTLEAFRGGAIPLPARAVGGLP
jgi:general secretion pathway protein I